MKTYNDWLSGEVLPMPDVFEHTKPNATVKIEEWYFDNCHIKIGDHCFDIKLTKEQFNEMISGLIASGVTFEAEALKNGLIEITFTGGY